MKEKTIELLEEVLDTNKRHYVANSPKNFH